MIADFPCFSCSVVHSNTNMADRESSSENNTRSRSVQDFVRTIVHAVTNLQTQLGKPNGAANSSSTQFSSADEEINARFQIPRQFPDHSATSTRIVPSTAYNPRQNYSPVQRNINRCPRRGRRNNYSTANARGENPTEFIYKDICQLPDPEWIQVPRGTIKGNLVQRGLYIDAFRLDKNWSEARLYSELALLFKETLECPGENDIGLVIMMDLYSIVQK